MLGIWARSCIRPGVTISLGVTQRSTAIAFHVRLGPTANLKLSLAPSGRSTRPSLGKSYSTSTSPPPGSDPNSSEKPKQSPWARLAQAFSKDKHSKSSFRKIISLAKPERKPLLIAVGLLFVSSAVSMSVPFTIGKLIDFFSSTNPVSSPRP